MITPRHRKSGPALAATLALALGCLLAGASTASASSVACWGAVAPTAKTQTELTYVKGGEYYGRITQRHNGGAIVAWVDGHVRWMKLPGPITQDNSLWEHE